ncbi:GAF domain-containing SpoIIE family protein phosphatase [Herbiconiux sp. KACC 21604]|uniref:SpoIIE family protein phosphatase n=1 Tax=unclassified Herbiconiux TaxID=2618217 RepID=UPI001491D83A|nr:GAF domain-containing SpoIIE family protein phosphatase [Herbiconiux sp. SALV-R1]QJU52999.1 SpoIIE family protein phosphatase [Herbiconiux sp. SALV-R1]WPO87930.1 GAF domain-containing SpoIIE family protein phosphatase [Herbiconiux sp. KACC 21604]
MSGATEDAWFDTPEEDARLEAVAAVGVLGTPPEERFDRITRLAQELLQAPMSYLNMVDRDSLVVKSPQPEPGPAPRYPYGTAFCEYTVHGEGLFEVPDARHDPRFRETPAVTHFGVGSYAGVPLRVPGGLAVGTLCVMHPEARSLSAEERSRLEALGRWAEGELREGLEEPVDAAGAASRAHELPSVHAGSVDATALALPFGEVSGDLYGWSGDDDAIVATLGDVMGKGPRAGAVAEALRSALHSGTADTDGGAAESPGEALRRVARELAPRLDELGAFVTLFHARIDTRTGVVEFADAGHGLTLHLSQAGTTTRLASHDMPLGLHDEAQGWAVQRVQLERGDILLSVTDGMLDAYDSTLASLDRIAEELRAQPAVPAFLDTMTARIAIARVDDDVTILAITFG